MNLSGFPHEKDYFTDDIISTNKSIETIPASTTTTGTTKKGKDSVKIQQPGGYKM